MKRYKHLFPIFGVIIIFLLGVINSGWELSVVATVIIFLGIIPLLTKLRNRDETLPFFEFMSLAYILYFAAPVILTDVRKGGVSWAIGEIPETTLLTALFLALLGYIFLCAGFYGIKNRKFLLFIPRLKIGNFSSKESVRIAIFLFLLAIASDIYSSVFKVPFVLRALFALFKLFPRISVGLLFIEFLKKRLSHTSKILLFFLFIPYILLKDFSGGSLAPFILDVSLFAFLLWYVKRAIPFHVLILAALFITPFFGKRQEYRSYVWYGTYKYAPPIKRAQLFWTLVTEGFKEEKLGMFSRGYRFIVKRANHLSELAVCIEETPSIIPYWHGRSLKPLLTAVIPRFVMPWKPQENMGQEFGHRYNFISPNDYGTSINLPMLIELYINFGAIGIIIGMFLIGVVYRILYRIMNYEGMSEGVAVIGAIIFMNLMNIESNISLVFGNVVENTIIMYLIFLVLKIRKE